MMDQKGWISIHRKLIDNPIWTKKPFDMGHAWIDILLHCNHKPEKFMDGMQIITVDRGQTAMSIKSWAKRWGWHESKVRRYFKTLESELMIGQKATNKTTILTVLNYDVYQVQPTNTSTNGRRTGDERATTNNKYNNDNKDNKLKDVPDFRSEKSGLTPAEINRSFFSAHINKSPRGEHYQKYAARLGDEIDAFVDYWTEPTKNGRRVRWEIEKTFDVGRRIGTWMKNNNGFGKNGKHDKDVERF